MLMCSSPQLIAAYHVLLRLCEPRHPPYALNYFSRNFFYYRVSSLNMSMNFTLTGMVENNGVEPKTFSIARDTLPLSYFLSIKIGRS